MVTGAVLDDPSLTSPQPAPRPAAALWWKDPASWAVLAALLVWAVPFTRAGGGRDPYALTYALIALLPGLALVRPWQYLRRLDLLALAPAAAALVSCFVSPTGFDGLDVLTPLAFAGVLFLLVRGYLARPHAVAAASRVGVVLAALVVAGVDQFASSWWAWYGRGDSAALMVGTFFWHNQFATYMAALGVLGAALAVRGGRRTRWAGSALVLLAVPSLVFAASRATIGLFVLALLVLFVASIRKPRSLVTLVVLGALGLALTGLLASPALMSESQSVGANIEQRETASGNAQARLDFDRVALRLVREHPLTGTGAHSFGGASAPYLPANISQPSAYVHNGFLQAGVDGGVLLGGAVLVAALLPLAVGGRRLWTDRLGRRGDRVDAVTLGSVAALALLAAHSAVDTDWTYPSLVALYAVLAALLLRTPSTHGGPDGVEETGRLDEPIDAAESDHDLDHDPDSELDYDLDSELDSDPDDSASDPHTSVDPAGRRAHVTAVALVAAIVATLVIAVPASARDAALTQSGLEPPTWARVASLGLPLDEGPLWLQGASTCLTRIQRTVGSADISDLPGDLDCTAAYGAVAPSAQIFRARAMARLGDTDQAEAIASDLAARHGGRIPQLIVLNAALPADSGDPAAAVRNLDRIADDPRIAASPAGSAYLASVRAALSGESGSGS